MTTARLLCLSVFLAAAGCSSPPPGGACSASNCTGCCDGDTCVENPGNAHCGLNGNACDVCVVGQSCQAGVCKASNSAGGGAGGGNGGGSAAGGGAGGGTGGGVACVPETDAELCVRTNRICGGAFVNDNCGVPRSVMSCGSCTFPQTCQSNGSCACIETDAEFCTRLSKQCGPLSGTDKCGANRTVANCANCVAPKTCDGAGQCTCTAETDAQFCTRTGKACGAHTAADNCGTTRTVQSCGTCVNGNVCGTGVCACPETNAQFCTRLGATCGALSGMDSCGNPKSVASCGTCTNPQTCGGGGTTNVCGCTPQTDTAFCAAQGKNCGSVTAPDNCAASRTANCGTCTAPQTCGGGTAMNVCGCTAETNGAFCTRLGKNCGNVTAPNNCGTTVTTSCGSVTCPGLTTCGGGGVMNVCGCANPETDAAFCTRLGKTCGSFTGNDNCGLSRTAMCGTCTTLETCSANVCGGRVEPITPVCGGGFCWENPLPTGMPLRAVETSPSGHNWAVGETGTILHWNGATWTGWFALTPNMLRGVWAFSDTDVWAAGDGATVLHYDGATWSPVATGVAGTVSFRGMWGAADGTLWLVGTGGTVLKRAPAGSFVAQTTPATGTSTLNAVFGIGTDVWVGGDLILRFNGVSWQSYTASFQIDDLWGGSTTDVWGASVSGVMRFNGTTWATSNAASGHGIHGFSTTDVWVAGSNGSAYHFNGLTWTASSLEGIGYTSPLHALTGWATDGTLLAVGDYGHLYRRTPSGGWSRQVQGVMAQTTQQRVFMDSLSAVGGSAFATGSIIVPGSFTNQNYGAFLRKSGSGWVLQQGSINYDVQQCVALSPTLAWAVDAYNAWRFNGAAWSTVPLPAYAGTSASIAGITSTEAWVVAFDKTYRYTGAAFTAVPNPISTTTVQLRAVGAADSTHVWAGGTGGNLLFWDGTSWASVPSGVSAANYISGIRMYDANHGFAWGSHGVTRWNGVAWTSLTTTQPTSIWPESTTTYWTVSNGLLQRYDGASLVNMAPWRTGTSLQFADAIGDGTNVWVLGSVGQVLKKQ